MAYRGRSASSDGMRLRNEDPKEHIPGSISPEFSSASQDCFRSVGNKETLKRQHDSILNGQGEADDEYQIDDPSPAAEKKRRLTIEQLNYLEMSFEGDMKLEPERKAFLAKRLGLVPRQVAIWFQNRRARWKNKQLEQEYEIVKAKYNIVVKENESLLKVNKAVVEENKKLMAEVTRMIILLQSLDNGHNSGVFQTLDIPQHESTRKVTTQALDPGYLLQEQQQQPEEGYLSSCKSELTVPTKSLDDQSEVQDSGQSYDAPVGMVGAPRAGMDNLKVAMVTLDDSEGFYGNVFNPLLIQRSAADSQCVEDACTFCLGWEDQGAGFFQFQ